MAYLRPYPARTPQDNVSVKVLRHPGFWAIDRLVWQPPPLSLRAPHRILSKLPKENESQRIVIARSESLAPGADVAISYRSNDENTHNQTRRSPDRKGVLLKYPKQAATRPDVSVIKNLRIRICPPGIPWRISNFGFSASDF